MNIYYYSPDNTRPSWGLGMIYYHVWLLNKNNFNAYLIHDKKPFKLSWLDLEVPIRYLSDKSLKLLKDDLLVIPEFYASDKWIKKSKCRKIIFVQNCFYIFDGLSKNSSYRELGYEKVFYYMPHLKKALSQITSLPTFETPPFVAPYFFLDNNVNHRKKEILVYPKFQNRDYNTLLYILKRRLEIEPNGQLKKLFSFTDGWQIVELKKMTHKAVAKKMKEAAFFICLNTSEAFNSAVPEAMAAGCINICYDGIGPRDFLIDNENAFVFQNNDIFNLADKVVEVIKGYDKYSDTLNLMRAKARECAENFQIDELEKRLLMFFEEHLY